MEQIIERDKAQIKPAFESRYRSILGDRYDEFIDVSLAFLRRSIRVNTLKTTVDEVKKRLEKNWKLTPVPWCREGFWIESERRDVGNLTEHSLGYIYVQEAASMIPPIVLDPKPGERVLDMCASPGSKATQIAQHMENKGVLVCNDQAGLRIKALGLNLQRCGVTNSVVSLSYGQKIKDIEFDKILVDAPCSGTGTIRKSLKTLLIWNPNMIKRLAATQRKLISNAFNLLKKGGTLAYSTCSLEPEENEGVVSWLLENNPDAKLEKITEKELPGLKRSNAITEFEKEKYNPEVSKCLRIWPQDNDTEGFFVTKIKKL